MEGVEHTCKIEEMSEEFIFVQILYIHRLVISEMWLKYGKRGLLCKKMNKIHGIQSFRTR